MDPPFSKLVGSAMETSTTIDHLDIRTLLDTGSMITCISASFVKDHLRLLPQFPIGHILCVKGPMDERLPYQNYVELEIGLPVNSQCHSVGLFPVLVAPDTEYNRKVPLLLGTNVLDRFYEQVCGDRQQPLRCGVDKPVAVALQTISLRKRHLEKTDGVYGLVRSSGPISLKPKETVLVKCNTQVAIPVVRSMVMVQSRPSAQQVESLEVTPGVILLDEKYPVVSIELTNHRKETVSVEPHSVLAEIHQVRLEPVSQSESEQGFIAQFKLDEVPDIVSPKILEKLTALLLEEKAVFATSKHDIGSMGLNSPTAHPSRSMPGEFLLQCLKKFGNIWKR